MTILFPGGIIEGCETQVSGRLGMSRGRSPRHAQTPYRAREGKRSQ